MSKMYSVDEINKMKVPDLRQALAALGLDSRGIKAVLVDRLVAAQESGGIVPQVTNSAPANPFPGSPQKSVSPTKVTEPPSQGQVLSPTKASPNAQPAAESPVKVPTPGTVSPTKATAQNSSPVKAASPVRSASPAKAVSTPAQPKPADEAVANSTEMEAAHVQDGETAGAEPMETEEGKTTKRKAEEVNGGDTKTENENTAPVKKIKTEPPKPKPVEEDEPEFEDKGLVLDWYQSDLNLKIDKTDFLKAKPVIFDEFPWAYAGAKGTYGFTAGKLCFEVKWEEEFSGRNTCGKEDVQHRLRVGWSDLTAELQLGEEELSYGYDSHEGKFFKAGEIEDGGESYKKNDVIACYLDLESDPIEFKFAKNGVLLEKSITIPKADVEGKVWFPHVLVRNTGFAVNFGATEPAHPLLEGYQLVGKVEAGETRVRGPQRASSRAECEFVMLCGLACSGKTRWTKEHKSSNPDKHYIILGTSTVVERIMKNSTAPPKTKDILLSKAGRFTEKLMELAAARRRNYILDQSNLLPGVQRRKTATFEGFRRRAVVIIPSEDEYQNRIKSREAEQGKSVPKSTLLDMKAGYRLPEVGEIFAEVEFAGVSKEEAEALVKAYNKEGIDAGFGQKTGRGGRGFFRGGRGGRGFDRGGRGGSWRGAPMRGRLGHLMRGGFRGRGAPIAARVSRNPPSRGFMPRGGGGIPPPIRGVGRGGPSFGRGGFQGGAADRGGRRDFTPRMQGPPRGGGGGGSWVRGGSTSSPGRPLYGGRGGSQNGMRSAGPAIRPFAQNTNIWSTQSPSPFAQQQQGGFGGGSGGGRLSQGGFQNQVWSQQPQNWGRSAAGGGGGGFGGSSNQFADPWVQQVPDQGFGQSWDNSRSNMGMGMGGGGGRGGGRGGGGGTWQGYGGQTYNNFGGGGGGGGMYRR